MLLNGVNHVALLTHDTDRLVAFYREVFDAEIGIQNPDAVPGVHNPPGTPAARYATR